MYLCNIVLCTSESINKSVLFGVSKLNNLVSERDGQGPGGAKQSGDHSKTSFVKSQRGSVRSVAIGDREECVGRRSWLKTLLEESIVGDCEAERSRHQLECRSLAT